MSVKVVNSGPGVINVSAETTPAIQVTSPTVSPVRIEFLSSSAALLPSGGIEGAILRKDSAASYDTDWTPYSFPAADGEDAQVLVTDGAGALTFDHVRSIRITIRNDEGATIPAGTPVYSKGEVGGSERILVGIADASDPAKMPAIGIAETTLNTTSAQDGYAIMSGIFNTNVSGFTGLSEGDILYVSNSGGGLSQTKPTGTYLIQNVGIVLKTNGTILQGFQVSCIGRTNDVPNIATGNIWAGNADGVATATSVAYIDIANERVGIGTTSPSDKLHVSDLQPATIVWAKIENTSLVGAAGAGVSYKTPNRTWQTVGRETGYTIENTTAGSIPFKILSSGNVGIGTTSPSKKLEVSFAASTYGARFTRNDAAGSSLIEFANSAGVKNVTGYNAGVDGYTIGTSADTHLTVRSTGNVGIGTTSPTDKLDVSGNIKLVSTGDYIKFANDFVTIKRVSNQLHFQGYGGFTFRDTLASQDRLKIDSSGNVGIGTTSPSTKLHILQSGTAVSSDGVSSLVVQKSAVAGTSAAINIVSGDSAEASLRFGDTTDQSMGALRYLNDVDAFSIVTNNTDQVRITSNGNVGIGTTSPSQKLDVSGGDINLSLGNYIRFGGQLGIQKVNNGAMIMYGGTNATTGGFNFYTWNGSTYEPSAAIRNNGNVGIGTTSPQSLLHLSSGTSGDATLIIESDTDNNNENDNPQLQFKQDGGVTIAKAGLTGDAGQIFGNSLANAAYFGNDENASVQLYTNATAALTIREDGDVGIGTTSPTAKLHSMGADGSAFSLRLGRADTGSEWSFNHAGDDLRIYNQGGSGKDILFSVDAGGTEKGNKVGIGTALPSAKLDVVGLVNIKDGSNNVMISSANTAMTGASNTTVGYQAGRSNTSGGSNSFVGLNAGYSNTIGDSNSFVGRNAGYSNTSGGSNSFVGYQAGNNNDTGSSNTSVGYAASYSNTTGFSNTAVGRSALYNSTGSLNVAIGREAAYGGVGASFSNTTAVGYQALYDLTTGATNTAVGHQAGTNINTGSGNTAIGYQANFNGISTDGNTAVGKSTLYNTTGSLNVAVGGGAAYGGGGASFSNTVAVGYQALYDLTSGAGNTAVGYQASTNINSGANNTTVGYQAGYTNTTGIRNIFIGYQAGYNETGSDKLYINNSSGSNPLIYGDFNLRAATINGDLNVSSGNLRADAVEINGRSQTSPAAGEYGAGSKIVTQFATGTVTAGVVYVASSGAWVQGDADVGSASIGMIAVATDSASANSMLIEGVIKLSSNAGFSGASAGDVLYLSNTAGELTTTAPSGTGDYVRVCGYVVNALQHEVFFSPSKEWRVV